MYTFIIICSNSFLFNAQFESVTTDYYYNIESVDCFSIVGFRIIKTL